MRKLLLLLLAAHVLISSCNKPEDTAVPDNTRQTPAFRQAKPFSGTITFTQSQTDDLSCNCTGYIDNGTFNGSGNFAHLGLTTSKIKPCIQVDPDGIYVGYECASLTAANGDVLNLNVQPYKLYFTPAGLVATIHVLFDGGTGRFSNATGSFDADLAIDYANVATLTVTAGSINY